MYTTRKPRVAIFDMDGTLTDVSGIRHYVENGQGEKNFTAFHKASLFCPPHEWVLKLLLQLDERAVIVTGRDERFRDVTQDWLYKHKTYGRTVGLFMRAWGDLRKDYEIKREILVQKILPYYEPIFAVDDNPNVLALWREFDIPTVTVPGWEDGPK